MVEGGSYAAPAPPFDQEATVLQETNSAQECWTERDGAPRTAPTRSVFPDDALAVIYKPARNSLDCWMV